ncbi:hypothetical protein AK830_g1645 [Neonectria ditissima]|uniref:NADP-dependent oxidoreductase domain-containing protein n=1 Tax=Neonectria ditissima TaxID=78410 RepID=A0A0P7BYM2_9HYPO|nr:hypothetical protein AK830_g1645 [Neonectria ditissima]
MRVLTLFEVNTIGTSRAYRESEAIIGRSGAAATFQIHTKIPGGMEPESLSAHDSSVSIEESLDTMNEIFQEGGFNRFGLSNYLPGDVEKIYEYCQLRQYVLPTIYQGIYNPLARSAEKVLFSTLRRLGISFYAYSPIAGGFLAKSKEQILAGSGRFIEGSPYWEFYVNDSNLTALEEWRRIASTAGCHSAELAYRWIRFNSPLKGGLGDAVIVGANRVAQLEQTLGWLKRGPLDKEICDRIDPVWDQVKDSSPLGLRD